MPKHLPEHRARVERGFFVGVTRECGKDNLLVPCTNVLDGGQARTNRTPQEAVEYLHDVFPRLEIETGNVSDEEKGQVCGVGFLGELGDQFEVGICGFMLGRDGVSGNGRRTAVAVEDTLDSVESPDYVLASLKRAMA